MNLFYHSLFSYVLFGGSSKYLGVYFDSKLKKWKAQMMMEGNVRSLGYYVNEEDAAAEYAKAAFKYKAKKHSETYGGYDLSDVPPQPLIRKETCVSGFRGVHKNKERWEARIKGTALGTFDTPEEAAGIYARALFYLNREQKHAIVAHVNADNAPACQSQARPNLLELQLAGELTHTNSPNQNLLVPPLPNQDSVSSIDSDLLEVEEPIGSTFTSNFQYWSGFVEVPAETFQAQVDTQIFEV